MEQPITTDVKQVATRLDDEDREWLEAYAAARRWSIATALRVIVQERRAKDAAS